MKVQHRMTLDLQERSSAPVLQVKQDDCLTREVRLTLTNGGTAWDPPLESVSFQVAYCKMDRTGGCYDALPDGSPACVVDGGELVIQLHPQMLTVPGIVICELRMIHLQGARLSTFSFFLDVESAATAGIQSADYYRFTSLEQLYNLIGNLEKLQTTEKTSLVAALNELNAGAVPQDVLRFCEQILTPDQQAQVRRNISAASCEHTHDYSALIGQPPIPQIPDSLPANGGNADTVGGKTAAEIQTAAESAVPAAVEAALQEAKESGEFDGKTPVKGVDYFTEAEKAEMVQAVLDALGGVPVFGVVDTDKNIVLSGNLADGIYTLKYEDADGNVSVIGTLNHTNTPEPTYTNLFDPSTATLNARMSSSSSSAKTENGYVMSTITIPSISVTSSSDTDYIAVPAAMWANSANLFLGNEQAAGLGYCNAGTTKGFVVGDWVKIPVLNQWGQNITCTRIVVSLYVKGAALTASDIQDVKIYFNECPAE